MTINITISLNDCIAFFSAILALFSTYFTYWQYRHLIKEKKYKRILNKNFGSELFGKEVIERSTYCYIEPNCTDIDPTREAEPKNLCMIKGNLFSSLDDYLLQEFPEENAIHHILILADSGMGKTSFLLNYYAYNKKKSKKLRQRIAIIPLGIPNVDSYVDKVQDKKNTIIFLDAFDEDTKAIHDYRERLRNLMDICSQFKRVVITCRTQFFPRDEEIPKETGIVKVAPRKAGEEGIYIFHKLYLSPLSDIQVNEYLKKKFRWNLRKRKKAKLLIRKIPNLKVRPMLLSNIPDLIESGQEIKYSYQLYQIMIDNWLEREKRWVYNKEDLRQFSERLAYDLYVNREKRGAEKIPINRLLLLAEEWNIQLESWQLTGRSLLNRDSEGNYKFAHRSIMEFLFIEHFFKMKTMYRPFIKWTDQEKLFAIEYNELENIDFSKADLSEADFSNKNISNANLTNANISNAYFKEAKGLSDWIGKGINENGIYKQELLAKAIQNGFRNLFCANLSGINLDSVNLSSANLKKVNLTNSFIYNADISNANFSEADLSNTILLHTNISNSIFKETKGLPTWIKKGLDENGMYKKELLVDAIRQHGFTNLSHADLSKTDLTNLNLSKIDFSNTNISNANFKGSINIHTWIEKGLDENGTYKHKRLVKAVRNGLKNLYQAYLTEANFSSTNLISAQLRAANCFKTDFTNANLSKADLSKANLSNSNLLCSILVKTNLSQSNLSKANLTKTNLFKANLSGANLSEANLHKAYIKGTNLHNANFKNTKFIPKWIKDKLDKNGICKIKDEVECPTCFEIVPKGPVCEQCGEYL